MPTPLPPVDFAALKLTPAQIEQATRLTKDLHEVFQNLQVSLDAFRMAYDGHTERAEDVEASKTPGEPSV